MAITLTAHHAIDRTTHTFGGNAVKVNLPKYTGSVIVRYTTQTGRFNFVGTDGGALSDYMDITTNTMLEIPTGGYSEIYLSSSAATALVEICAIPKGKT